MHGSWWTHRLPAEEAGCGAPPMAAGGGVRCAFLEWLVIVAVGLDAYSNNLTMNTVDSADTVDRESTLFAPVGSGHAGQRQEGDRGPLGGAQGHFHRPGSAEGGGATGG